MQDMIADDAQFLTRNVVSEHPIGGLERRLREVTEEGRPLRVKLGIDPTAPDVHLGHAVVLQKLREFQDLGHQVVLIIGDYTARVGDPTGRSTTRPLLSDQQITDNARTYHGQARRVLDQAPDRLEVRQNSEWLEMPMVEFLTLARIPKIAQLLAREDFNQRFTNGKPISLLELLYPLLQGYDSVAVNADVEIGGTDQTFNVLMGRDVQRAHDQVEQVVITMPLLVGVDGQRKMSKSLGNHIGIAEPAEEIFGKTMSIPDETIGPWSDMLGVDLTSVPENDPHQRKQLLAWMLCERFTKEGSADEAQKAFHRLFRDREVPADIPTLTLPDLDVVHLPAVISDAFSISRAEARRVIDQGGVKLEGHAWTGPLDLPRDALSDAVLQVGKRRFVKLLRPA